MVFKDAAMPLALLAAVIASSSKTFVRGAKPNPRNASMCQSLKPQYSLAALCDRLVVSSFNSEFQE